jgi:hypothetical protein
MQLPSTITLFGAPHDVTWETGTTNAGRELDVARIFPRHHAFSAWMGFHSYWVINGKEDYLTRQPAFIAVSREIRAQLPDSANIVIVGTLAQTTMLVVSAYRDSVPT